MFLSLILSLAKPGLPYHAGTNKSHAIQEDSNGVLLVYSGSFASPQLSYDVGIHFEMDSSIGISYQVTFERGSNVLSHIAIFYKFSSPNQSTIYNYLTNQSYISYNKVSTGGSGVNVVGSETIGNYSCTHLQYLDQGGDHISKDDYWMSSDLPGFQTIIKVLNQLNSNAGLLMINSTIFNWGGLVKMSVYNKKNGFTSSAVINLVEANTNMDFPATDFDVPSNN